MSDERKRLLTPEEQVEHLASKGVTFDLCSKSDAMAYLRENNSFFRLRSYRLNYEKRVGGERDGQYIGLDFAMLADLAGIDMHLRNEMLPLTLDIEHYTKVELLGEIERRGEDGYKIVQDYLSSFEGRDGRSGRDFTIGEISRGKSSPYTRGLIERHPNADYSVWEFFEVIPFGRFSHFYLFCARRFDQKAMENRFYLMQSVKGLRNACAHNNCIINDMRKGDLVPPNQDEIMRGLGEIGIGKSARYNKMKNERFQQIATTLYLHSKVSSNGTREHRGRRLEELMHRMARHADYYPTGSLVNSGLSFIKAMICGWYDVEASVH